MSEHLVDPCDVNRPGAPFCCYGDGECIESVVCAACKPMHISEINARMLLQSCSPDIIVVKRYVVLLAHVVGPYGVLEQQSMSDV